MHSFIVLAIYVGLAAVDAPIAAVTVYSDRARVTRAASVSLSGTQRLELPLLVDTVDPASIRVEASGAEVRRVDLAPASDEEIPTDQVRALLDELEKKDDEIAKAEKAQETYRAQLVLIERLRPSAPSQEPLKPSPRLSPGGWQQAIQFADQQEAELRQAIRGLAEQGRRLSRERQTLADKAALLGGARRRSGHRVFVTLAGNGQARLTLTYMVMRARWVPTYDLQLLPDTGKVVVQLAGLVSQETGENWNGAALTLSTAVPSTATELPRLTRWTIGERDRFIPTPIARPEPLRPPPPAAPPPLTDQEPQVWRDRLVQRARIAGSAADKEQEFPPPPPPISAEPQAPMPAPERPQRGAYRSYDSPPSRSRDSRAPAAAPAPMWFNEETAADGEAPPPTVGLSLAPPPAYRAPTYAADLPASLAGGYDLTYSSLRPETVESGKGARRVALLSETWPVAVERKVFPAVAREAFLVAEIKSPSKAVLPGGAAQLFVGADPAGTARLGLISPGQTFTLPLGLDRAIRPVRNVRLVQSERGIFGKDDVSEYVVTIELANPYALPIAVRVLDQWPLAQGENVEVKLLDSKPVAIQDKQNGILEWRLTLAPSSKTVVSFTYSLRRPKGWRMHQR